MGWKIRRDGERYYVDANTMPGAQKALRLAAAAPELLEALEEIVKQYYENPDNGRTLRWAIDGAKEVIAKAKGEEQ